MTEVYAPEEPEYDPDYEPQPEDGTAEEPPEPTVHRPEPETRRDAPLTTDQAREQALANIRKIRTEHGLVTNPNIKSGRDQ